MKNDENMKRLIVLLAGIVSFAGVVSADNDRAVTMDRLPEKAREFIQEHFASEKIAYVKQERDFLELKYEVMTVGGVMIDFDRSGNWTELECRYDMLCVSLIPAPVKEYVSSRWPDVSYRKISRSRNEYEVKLSSGLELTFDRNFNLIEIDD